MENVHAKEAAAEIRRKPGELVSSAIGNVRDKIGMLVECSRRAGGEALTKVKEIDWRGVLQGISAEIIKRLFEKGIFQAAGLIA